MSIASICIVALALIAVNIGIWFIADPIRSGLSFAIEHSIQFCTSVDSFFAHWWLIGGILHWILLAIFIAITLLAAVAMGAAAIVASIAAIAGIDY